MLTNKTFVKKTKKGQVVKVVREHYLRDDISCGSLGCKSGCAAEGSKLPDTAGPYLVVDTNIVLHQMDFLEHTAIDNVIVMSVVLEEVRSNNSSIHQRLRALTQNAERRFFVFANEHHTDTFVKAEEGETPNDRNDRAIRTAALWYKSHLPGVRVVMISNDVDNRRRALEAGLEAFSAKEYAAALSDKHPDLADRVARSSDDPREDGGGAGGASPSDRPQKRTRLFPDHKPMSELVQGIKSGRFHQGSLRVNRFSPGEAWVGSESVGADILISGRTDLNRAMDGDVVAVELLPEAEWKRESSRLKGGRSTAGPATPELSSAQGGEEEDEDDGVGTGGGGLEAGIFDPDAPPEAGPGPGSAAGAGGKRPTGRVIGIIKRAWRSRGYCGSLVPPRPGQRVSGTASLLFQPVEPRFPRIRIQTRQAEALMDKRIVVSLDTWDADSLYPSGHYVKTLGPIGDRDTETEVVVIEHDINTAPFSQAVYDCVPPLPWEPSAADRAQPGREDLRGLRVFSVDPPGCRDIDDALHARLLPNGNIEVGVHIADVTHFVRPGTPLDEEAALRATTTYLVNRRIDMLPKALTEEICSLKGGVERLAFSAIWEMTQDGEEVSVRFTKSLIKSAAAMTYAEAQSRIDDTRLTDGVSEDLRLMNRLAKSLRKRRFEGGALELASPEVKFQIDTETHNPTDVAMYEYRDTNRMVEELMLLGNIAVATAIERSFKPCALLRRHPVPTEKMFEPLVRAAAAVGFHMDVTSSLRLAKSLDAALRVEDPYFNKLIRIMATRCMTQAIYFSSGDHSEPEYYHYGLACRIYTHFTSPIRRYADVVVHRLLSAAIGLEPLSEQSRDPLWIERVVENLNTRHKNARMAGRASVDLFTTIFFAESPQTTDARVTRVKANGLIVFVPKFGIEGPVLLGGSRDGDKGAMAEKKVVLDEEGQTLRAADGSFSYTIFDRVSVAIKVEEGHGGRRKLCLTLVE